MDFHKSKFKFTSTEIGDFLTHVCLISLALAVAGLFQYLGNTPTNLSTSKDPRPLAPKTVTSKWESRFWGQDYLCGRWGGESIPCTWLDCAKELGNTLANKFGIAQWPFRPNYRYGWWQDYWIMDEPGKRYRVLKYDQTSNDPKNKQFITVKVFNVIDGFDYWFKGKDGKLLKSYSYWTNIAEHTSTNCINLSSNLLIQVQAPSPRSGIIVTKSISK